MTVYRAAYSPRTAADTKVTVTAVPPAKTTFQICEINKARAAFIVYNNTSRDAYVQYGDSATADSCTKRLDAFSYFESNAGVCYTGALSCWLDLTSSGSIVVTELI